MSNSRMMIERSWMSSQQCSPLLVTICYFREHQSTSSMPRANGAGIDEDAIKLQRSEQPHVQLLVRARICLEPEGRP